MKIFPNRRHLHPHITVAGLSAGLVMLVALSAGAQQTGNDSRRDGPVDLLANIAGGNADNGSAATPTISSIDEAVKAVSDAESDAAAPATATLTVGETPSAASSTTSSTMVTQPTTQPTAQPTAPAGNQSVTLQTADTVSVDAAGDDNAAPASASLTRGTVVSRFGVADIGLEPSVNEAATLTSTIWRGTPAERATLLLDSDAVIGASPALSVLAQRVVAHRAVPPVGADIDADRLVAARLAWLASAGRSEALEGLVGQLPDDEPWLEWKQWLVETQLMSRRDDEACRTVMYQVSRTFEPFWHKAKVICSAAMGDAASAQFAADILKAMGVDDAAFSALVDTLLTGTEAGEFDPALLEPLHIVLMDAAHSNIDTDGLAALSEGSVQTAVGLRYLAPEARLVSTWRALDRGLISHEKAAKLWRSAKITADDIDLALARHRSQPSPLTRALGWRALDADKTPRRLAFVAAMMDADIASGAGLMMAPLYAELVREALVFEGAGETLADDPALADKLGWLVSIGGSETLPAVLATPDVRAASKLLGLAAGTEPADIAPLNNLQMWHLLPLVDQVRLTGAGDEVERDWIGLAMPAEVMPASYLSISPVMLRALEQAAGSGSVAETILLAHRIVGTLDLAELHPADAARIVAALSAVGQQDTALALSGEVVAAHLMAEMQAVEIALPPRSEAAATIEGSPDDSASMTDPDADPDTGAEAETQAEIGTGTGTDSDTGADTATGLRQDANADS